ncbi:MAG: ribosome maturation factor RimP [Gammaproteobacteria bacterium]|nr:ribosome maturation factor RimP [Gammaproteobacteria bacterium]MCW8909120.1 ribosome maturation factor RimP [Gammaproteobacteria bacterium]MCW9005906.1 ribosome maturation factor RimP [Gammaproteobacteria bacterium]MCW9056564.1 ribosome maturation factor RimP [Gammaproteobacteria bacterium]
MPKHANDLWALIEPVVTGLGYEVVDIEFRPHPRDGLLRVFIDHESGIQMEDCETVSRQLSAMIDVEDPVPGHFNLEVSSPGLDRPLRKAADFEKFTGEIVKIKLNMPTIEGQRNFTGKLLGLKDNDVLLEVDGETKYLPLGGIDKARLVPQF